MIPSIKLHYLCAIGLFMMSCNAHFEEKNKQEDGFKVMYQSSSLIITKISTHTYQHESFLISESFGKVSCNGLLVIDEGECIVFDTPADDSTSKELIVWVQDAFASKIKLVVPTHFHEDCLGGLNEFTKLGIASNAFSLTNILANSRGFNTTTSFFERSLDVKVGSININVQFLGEGHTKDNVVAYVSKDKVLFGGCLVKSLGAGKGNIADANLNEWSNTVKKVKNTFPETRIVIPGHGKPGNIDLLDFTIKLFQK